MFEDARQELANLEALMEAAKREGIIDEWAMASSCPDKAVYTFTGIKGIAVVWESTTTVDLETGLHTNDLLLDHVGMANHFELPLEINE